VTDVRKIRGLRCGLNFHDDVQIQILVVTSFSLPLETRRFEVSIVSPVSAVTKLLCNNIDRAWVRDGVRRGERSTYMIDTGESSSENFKAADGIHAIERGSQTRLGACVG